MKFTLTIEGDTQDAQSVSVLALIASIAEGTVPNIPTAPTPATITTPMPQPQTAAAPAGDDNDEGDVNTNAPAVDSTGLPWDERIHAKTKATVADGTWRKRRNVDTALVQQVEAELRARTAQQPATVQPQPQPQPAMPDPSQIAAQQAQPQPQAFPDPSQIAAQQSGSSNANAASGAAPEQPAPAAATGGELTFATFMQAVSAGMASGKIDAGYLANLANTYGVPSVTALSSDPAKMQQAYQHMQIDGKI